MILTFHVPPLARGQKLCDIDGLWSRKFRKNGQLAEINLFLSSVVNLERLDLFRRAIISHFFDNFSECSCTINGT